LEPEEDDMNHDRELEVSSRDISRRMVAKSVLGGGLMAAFLAIGSQADARAQGTPESADFWPSRYTLKSGEIEVSFTPANESGDVRLEYRDVAASITFTGDDVTSEISPAIGRFVSVVIEQVDDGYVRYLTLLVPNVNRDENGHDVPITTVAVMTRQMTSIGGPRLVKGALQRYEVIELEGVAQFAT
jgi:hypothetical protein